MGAQGYLTGPVVAPGVVAFGASSVPIASGSNAVATGGPPQVGEMPMKATVRYQNVEVLKSARSAHGRELRVRPGRLEEMDQHVAPH